MSPLPLQGIKVLDLSHLLPGPLCTLMLSDLGAEVLKIERGPHGDFNRLIPPFYYQHLSTYFMMLNRNKKTRILNLKSEKEKKVFLKLVKEADIVVENFRPGALAKLGLDYKTLSRINPKLIYCAISGYGQQGPWRNMAGHDLNYIALTGILETAGFRGQKPPMLSTQLADIVGGSLLPTISILAALEHRRKTHKGMFIDSAMMPATMVLLMMVLGKFFLTGEEPYQEEDRMTGRYPNYALYQTKDKRAMALAAIEAKFWYRFCELIHKEEFKSWVPLTDAPGFPTASLANASDQKLKRMKRKLGLVFKTKTQKEWIRLFKSEPDVCCTPVNNFKEALELLTFLGRKDFFMLKNTKGQAIPQMLFPFGNSSLHRKKHTFPPRLDK
ncbi:MAG TPA: CoA transferase [Deltaproteobacteria bacterium]|nr:CoA transferase [Deltaproteobacteria bacterium]